jgi:hypothetical protein
VAAGAGRGRESAVKTKLRGLSIGRPATGLPTGAATRALAGPLTRLLTSWSLTRLLSAWLLARALAGLHPGLLAGLRPSCGAEVDNDQGISALPAHGAGAHARLCTTGAAGAAAGLWAAWLRGATLHKEHMHTLLLRNLLQP